MNHPAPPTASTHLRRHVDKTLHLAMQIPIRPVFAIFAPLTAEDASRRRILGHRRDLRVSYQGQPLRLVQPSAAAPASGKSLVEERRANDAYDGLAPDDHADRDAKHGEQVRVVDGAVERVDDPGRDGGGVGVGVGRDEVGSAVALGVGLFAYEEVGRVAGLDGGFDEGLDVFVCLGDDVYRAVLFDEGVLWTAAVEAQLRGFHEHLACILAELHGEGVDLVEVEVGFGGEGLRGGHLSCKKRLQGGDVCVVRLRWFSGAVSRTRFNRGGVVGRAIDVGISVL